MCPVQTPGNNPADNSGSEIDQRLNMQHGMVFVVFQRILATVFSYFIYLKTDNYEVSKKSFFSVVLIVFNSAFISP
jgi:hypothetical protein